MGPEIPLTDTDGIQGGAPIKSNRFVSFDGGVVADGRLQRPDRYRYWSPRVGATPSIPRGAGLSYAAASFSQGGLSVEHGSFNRILDFDSDQRLVEVEAGIELSTLYDFLSLRGLYLPIQPGHGRITVGGCIAADVHGKNHARDGTFINQVVSFTLFHPLHGQIEVSPEAEPALFRLTCGGYGLTGHILRAKLRANVIPSHTVHLNAVAVSDASSGIVRLAQEAPHVDFAYTWHDFMTTGRHFGRGYLVLGVFSPDPLTPGGSLLPGRPTPNLSAVGRGSWRLPVLNRLTTIAMNFAYRGKQELQGRIRRMPLRDALFPIHETQFYFKLFGTPGFHEYQVIVPTSRLDEYLESVRGYLARRPLAVTLASAKLFRGRPELLRFTGEGTCFALNFPRSPDASAFLTFLDGLVISLAGIPNIIKDSRLPRSVVEACYPGVHTFRDQLHAFDPKRLFRSELSERLGL